MQNFYIINMMTYAIQYKDFMHVKKSSHIQYKVGIFTFKSKLTYTFLLLELRRMYVLGTPMLAHIIIKQTMLVIIPRLCNI